MYQAHKPTLGPYSTTNPRRCEHCGIALPDMQSIAQACGGERCAVTVMEMLEELTRRGFITPGEQQTSFDMPTVLRTVPTFVTYGTPELPVTMGTGDARLEQRPARDRG
jgi:hypothetical protein